MSQDPFDITLRMWVNALFVVKGAPLFPMQIDRNNARQRGMNVYSSQTMCSEIAVDVLSATSDKVPPVCFPTR